MSSGSASIAAVVLAYSRRDYLEKLVAALRAQTRPLDEIVVVDQSSLEAIHGWLAAQTRITVIRQENQGSAGGFCRGIEESIRRGHDWTWIFDDDAVPERDALERLTAPPCFFADETAFMVSRVVNPEGETQQRPIPAGGGELYVAAGEDHVAEVTRATWLGLLVSTRAVRAHGLPVREFFIWHEDQEFTERLARKMKAYCVMDSVIVHYQSGVFNPKLDPGDRLKYLHGVRNEIGWITLSGASFPRKCWRILKVSGKTLREVLIGSAPAESLLWLLNGVAFFRPRIRRID